MARRTEVETGTARVSAALDGSEGSSVLVVLAHGAGAGMDSDFMIAIGDDLSARGFLVARFNFPFVERGRKSPDRPEVLEAAFRDVVAHFEDVGRGRKLGLGGKSLGGRIPSHVVAARVKTH